MVLKYSSVTLKSACNVRFQYNWEVIKPSFVHVSIALSVFVSVCLQQVTEQRFVFNKKIEPGYSDANEKVILLVVYELFLH